jgi:hypothetical protein
VIPFNVELGGKRVGITLESLIWFFIATAAATVIGEIAYFYVQTYLPALPKTNNTVNTSTVQAAKVKA